jgi:hypothetical protein
MNRYLLALALAACVPDLPPTTYAPTGAAAAPVCWRTTPKKTCRPCPGCSACFTDLVCEPCTAVEGTGCWHGDVLLKCLDRCPSGSMLNGTKVP